MDEISPNVFVPAKKRSNKPLFLALLVGVLALFLLCSFFIPPRSFPKDAVFTVAKGDTLAHVADSLESGGYVRSGTTFTIFFLLFGSDTALLPGEYDFSHAMGVLPLAKRIAHHDFGALQIKITFPEGLTVHDSGEILAQKLPLFDKASFEELTKGKEGYLFPETYFFFPSTTTEEVVTTLEETFQKNIDSLHDEIALSGHTEEEIVIMASLVEKEASNSDDERKIIAGILWKRISLGLPLQVDAPFAYLLGKASDELTLSDLKIDSPYNTYIHTGLPPTAIGNPGLSSLRAAADPTPSPYLFYLHGSDGTIHYARTFEEHKKNKEKYL